MFVDGLCLLPIGSLCNLAVFFLLRLLYVTIYCFYYYSIRLIDWSADLKDSE